MGTDSSSPFIEPESHEQGNNGFSPTDAQHDRIDACLLDFDKQQPQTGIEDDQGFPQHQEPLPAQVQQEPMDEEPMQGQAQQQMEQEPIPAPAQGRQYT